MSLILNGRITYEFLISGGVVSLIVASILIFVLVQSQKLIFEKDVLQKEVAERTRNLEEVNASLVQENTKRRLAEERIVALIDALPDIIYFKDTESRNLVVNLSFENITGHKKEDAVGKTDMELLPPALAEHCKKQDEEVIRGGKLMRFEEEHDFHGETLFQETIKVPLYDERGVATGLVGITRDITERKKAEEEIRNSEKKFRNLFESAEDAIFILDMEGNFVDFNRKAHERLGYTKDEMMSIGKIYRIHPQEFASRVPEQMEYLNERGSAVFEWAHQRKDGTVMPVEVNVRIVDYERQKAMLSVVRDITERKKAEKELGIFLAAVEYAMDGIQIVDLEGRIIYSNRAVEEIYGYTREELKGTHVNDMNVDPEFASREILPSIKLNGRWDGEIMVKRKGGGKFPIWLSTSLIKNTDGMPIAMVGTIRDITERKKIEEQVKRSLKEKDVLLQEIHHRVKNNMQVISSLLSLQSRYIKDGEIVHQFLESQNRIRSMALIHEKLYMSENLASIDFKNYVEALTESLKASFGKLSSNVRFAIDMDEIALNADSAISCGLIINELVSNSIKHAFPEGNGGEVSIAVKRNDTDELELTVTDNGIGIPKNVDFMNPSSLGLDLVSLLAKNQLGGKIELDSTRGTRFLIRFSELHYNKRV